MTQQDTTVGFSALGRPVIDCDLHNALPDRDVLLPYLSDHWVARLQESGFEAPDANDYPPGAPTSAVPSAIQSDSVPGSDLGVMQGQLLDPWQTEVGILSCLYRTQSVQNEDLASALSSAINQWQIDEWLERDARLRASLVVPSQNPERAAREIDRFGGHPGFVQVLLPVRSDAPYGNERYDPIYEAAARHDLAIGIHSGGAPGFPPTPAGWPTSYLEELVVMTLVFQAQLTSLTFGGAFSRFPDLRVALIEGGFTWLPSWLWRADKDWKSLRRETPWVKRPPSDYVREHVRLTLQPIDAPVDSEELLEVIGHIESDELLLFSTDYPHLHFDSPADAVPAGLSESLLAKILTDNARAFYRL